VSPVTEEIVGSEETYDIEAETVAVSTETVAVHAEVEKVVEAEAGDMEMEE
jgi:hypothetical protein